MHAANAIKSTVLALTVIGLSSCASPALIRLADGSTVYRIDCAGSATGLNYCYSRAGKTCGAQGFSVVDDLGNVMSLGARSTTDQDEQVMLYAADKNSLLIKCGT